MNKAVPWSIKGIDFDAREAAKEAARRDGVTLGEWMNRAIADRAAEMGASAQDFDADERLEAVAAQLARLSSQMDDDEPPRRRRGESGRRQDLRQDLRQETPRGEAPQRDEGPFERARFATSEQEDGDEDFAPPREPRRRPAAPSVASFPERPRAKRPRDAFGDDRPSESFNESRRFRSGRGRSGEADDLLEQAVAAFEDQAGRVEARTARAIANVANLIEFRGKRPR